MVKPKIPGIVFSESLAKTAAIADKITVVRSLTGRIPDHAQATYQMFTGDLAVGGDPASVHRRGRRRSIRTAQRPVRLTRRAARPEQACSGYLSLKFGAFELGGDLSRKDFKVRDMALPGVVTEERLAIRRYAREAVEDHFRQVESNPGELDAMDDFYSHALQADQLRQGAQGVFVRRRKRSYREAVRRVEESPGRRSAGHRAAVALARRLVEAGVRFVTVVYKGTGGWDNHIGIKDAVVHQEATRRFADQGDLRDIDVILGRVRLHRLDSADHILIGLLVMSPGASR